MINYTYMDVITTKYSNIMCHCAGNANTYESIIWDSGPVLPPQAALDADRLTMIKDAMWELIKVERDHRKNDGGYLVGTDWYHSDTSSRIQQLGLVMMGAGLPSNLYWKTMSGTFVLMTQTLSLQIFQTAAASDMSIFTIAEQKKAAMLASATPATYDYLSGWPAIYGE
jgi:hypothetical protein